MRDSEKTIGNLIDKQGVSFVVAAEPLLNLIDSDFVLSCAARATAHVFADAGFSV